MRYQNLIAHNDNGIYVHKNKKMIHQRIFLIFKDVFYIQPVVSNIGVIIYFNG